MRFVLVLYRLAIGAFPPAFRRNYRVEMLDEAEAVLREGMTQGLLGLLRASVALVVDTVRTFFREWRTHLKMSTRGVSVQRPIGFVADLRYAIRSFLKTPGFTALAIATFGLGIGVSTSLFGIADAILLRPLAYPDPDRLVFVWPEKLFSRALLDLAREESRTFEGITAFDPSILTITTGGEPAELRASGVPSNHFAIVGIPPAFGRPFDESDHHPGQEPVVILSHRLWMERFGGDPSVLGKDIALSGLGATRRTVVGVMSPAYVPLQREADVWIPIVFDRSDERYSNSSGMTAVGRLRPGVELAAARSDIAHIAQLIQEQQPQFISDEQVRQAGVAPLRSILLGDLRPRLVALLAAASLVLIAAWINVANLLIARNGTREHEIAVRTALGAGRMRIVRQLVTEAVVLAVLGGVCGFVFTLVMHRTLVRFLPGVDPGTELLLDWRLFGFVSTAAAASALVGGVLPGWYAARVEPGGTLRGARSGDSLRVRRSQFALLAGEVAVAITLAFAAALLVKSVHRLQSVPIGFDASGVTTFRITAPVPGDDDARALQFFQSVRNTLAAVPGVEGVGLTSRLPMSGGISQMTIFPEGYQSEGGPLPTATHRVITPGIIDALGYTIVAGRDLTELEAQSGPLKGLINRTLANEYWPDQDPVGRRFIGRGGVTWFEVVGVVDDVRDKGPMEEFEPTIYVPHRDWVWRTMYVAARSAASEPVPIETLKRAVWDVDARVPITRISTMNEIVQRTFAGERATAGVVALFAVAASVLSAIGVTGVVGHTVAERRREIGIRAALGASRPRLLLGELWRTGKILLFGLIAGVAGALVAGRLLGSMVFEVQPHDPILLALVLGLMGGVGIVAALVPARKGTTVDPVDTLRA